MDPLNNQNQINLAEASSQPTQAEPVVSSNPMPTAGVSAGWFSGGKLVAIIVAAVLILGIGIYFAFFAGNHTGNKNFGATDQTQSVFDSSGENAATANSDNQNSKAIVTCGDLITLDQVKSITGATNLTAVSQKNNNASGFSDSSLGCAYSIDATALSVNQPFIVGSFGVGSYLKHPENLNNDYLPIKSSYAKVVDITGLGSQAFEGIYSSAIPPQLNFVSSNKTFIIYNLTIQYKPDDKLGTLVDMDKSFQIEQDMAKIIDANLNKY